MRRTLKWMLYPFVAIVVALLGSWLLVPDESLLPDVEALLVRASVPPAEENGYFLLWGLRASPGMDPHAAGLKIVEEHERVVEAGARLTHFTVDQYLGSAMLPLPTAIERCRGGATNCLQHFQSMAPKAKADIDEYALQIARYRSLRDYSEFSEEVFSTRVSSPLMDYPALVAASDLVDAFRLYDVVGFSRLLEIQRSLIEAAVPQDRVAEFLSRADVDLGNPYSDQAMNFNPVARTISFAGHGKLNQKDGLIQVELAR